MAALSIDYVARETGANLRRNLLMTGASVLCVAVSLTIVGAAFILKQGVATATIQWQGGVELAIYMQPGASPGESSAVEHELATMSGPGGPNSGSGSNAGAGSRGGLVKSFHYVNQQQSYQEFQKLFANQPTMVAAVSPSDLPPSYRVVPSQASEAAAVGAQFSNYPGVKQVEYPGQAINTLIRITSLVQKAMLGMAAALLIAALALILNTIRMAIFARRREVAVMKLVGATNWFIRIPFMLEGLIQGLIGAAIAFGFVFGVRSLIASTIHHYHLNLVNSFIVSAGDVIGTGIFVVVVGVVVGALGSALAVRSFLDV